MSAGGIITEDGRDRPVDCIINATGFRTTEFMFPMEITGAGGRTLRETWAGAPTLTWGSPSPAFRPCF